MVFSPQGVGDHFNRNIDILSKAFQVYEILDKVSKLQGSD